MTNTFDYVHYDPETGKILESISIHSSGMAMNPPNSEHPVAIGAGNTKTHYVSGGEILTRPQLSLDTVTGSLVSFTEDVPEGTILHLHGSLIDQPTPISGRGFYLNVPENVPAKITPPFPYTPLSVTLTADAIAEIPENVTPVFPSLPAAQEHYTQLVAQHSILMKAQILGEEDTDTKARHLLKRAMYDRHLMNRLTPEDHQALSQEVLYSDKTINDLLGMIGKQVSIENWVTFRSDGIRQTTTQMIQDAQDVIEVQSAIQWATEESALALSQAADMKEAL